MDIWCRPATSTPCCEWADITPLKQPGAQVLVKLPPRQEPERVQRPKKRSVMDALTKAGLELYQQLRTLRFEIAQREGLPPYVVFGDKSAGRYVPACPRNGGRDDRYLRHGRAQVREVCRPVLCGHRRLPRRPPRRSAEPGCPRSGARTGNTRKNRQARAARPPRPHSV